MRGLNWMLEQFRSAEAVLSWAFKHQARNLYGESMLAREIVTPDNETEPPPQPHPALEDFGLDDYHAVSAQVLKDAKALVGRDWPVLVLAFDSYRPIRRLEASIGLQPRFSQYPKDYFIAVSSSWRITSKMRPKLLVSLAGTSERTERRWRSDIIGALEDMLEEAMEKIGG